MPPQPPQFRPPWLMHSIVGVFGVKEMALFWGLFILFTYTQTTKNTDSVVHLNQHMSSNHTLHKRQISVKSKMVILYLAGTLLEYFLEASALLWLW